MLSHKKKAPAAPTSATAPSIAPHPSIEGPGPDLEQVESAAETPVLDMAQEASTGPSFGDTSAELLARTDLEVSRTGSFAGVDAIPPSVASQLLAGIEAEGVSDATTAEVALSEYVDEGRVEVYTIVDPATGQTFTWLSFTAGDTEVGYIFRAGTTQLTAIVSDGDITPA